MIFTKLSDEQTVSLFLLFLFTLSLVEIITACTTIVPIKVTATQPPMSAPTIKTDLDPLKSRTETPTASLLTPSSTSTIESSIPPLTLTIEPTITASETPTSVELVYHFPIQPASVANYVQGHHDYPATDIFAPEGAPFVAITNGLIDFIRFEDVWDPTIDDPATRGGMAIAVIGYDGVRYYGSHLSAIAPGVKPGMHVSAGQILGFVGNSGNARYVDPHLHFGISNPTFPEDWAVRRGEIDPFPLLQSWVSGYMVTPVLP